MACCWPRFIYSDAIRILTEEISPMRRALPLFALTSAVLSAPTAADLDSLGFLNQAQFRLLSEDLGAALSYKAILPAGAARCHRFRSRRGGHGRQPGEHRRFRSGVERRQYQYPVHPEAASAQGTAVQC